MNHYMVVIELPDELTEEFVSIIPYQREHINLLMAKKIVSSYSLANDRSKLWVTVISNSAFEVEPVIQGFPLARFMKWRIVELVFYNSVALSFPDISVN